MPSRRPQRRQRRSRRRLSPRVPAGALLAVLLLGVLVAAAAAYDQTRRGRLAPGIEIGGVNVGGLDVATARERILAHALIVRRRTLRVHAGDRVFAFEPAQARVGVDVDRVLARAAADSRRGWLGTRVLDGLTGHRVDESLALRTTYSARALTALLDEVAAATARPPGAAAVKVDGAELSTEPGQPGVALDRDRLRRRVIGALSRPGRSTDLQAVVRPVSATVTQADLAARYPAYIVVDRADHVLRYYSHLALSQTYPIAVGMAGLETPTGLYDVQWKEVDPPWRVPNSAWAGKLAGRTIPPGPKDPIKARWMAFDGGAGIHGIDPGEYGSIGHDASHGCVRMRIPDVIDLYDKTPVGTPVYVS